MPLNLNDRQLRLAKPTDKKQTFADGGGLSFVVASQERGGTKYFVYNFRFDGKAQSLRIGKYPDISLSEARQQHQQARSLLAAGVNPAAEKQKEKTVRKQNALHTFELVALEWHKTQAPRWKENHAKRVLHSLSVDVFPTIGHVPVNEITVKDVKRIIESIAKRGATETANQIRQRIEKIFNYAALMELVDSNPAIPLQGFINQKPVEHMPALPREQLSEFYCRLFAVDAYQANKLGIMLLMLCFARNHEIRGGEWSEIDWNKKEWHIPASRMKRPRPHVIPLADWTIKILKQLHTITGHGRYMFPNRNKPDSYISENTFGYIINKMGYKGIATPHGFRSLASSLLNEQGFNPDAIERQLAHVEGNKIRAAYNRAEYMDERANMMQWYADWLKNHYEQAKNEQSSPK
ncbi:tyrosine-type recombinase/integrase [Vitreoscilla stercoraria]|uniref:Tyrosine-type recombinase/integrase n=1 Tax=Vitreoscilla stercoraria TaxID=61 RepID=A0ABY4ECV5_VITST|nr:integrase arm-type DNA-binding domain-containing protein [Vitreoscilla stercoraria]UOO93556.1 tyrosine-type recombinase/integrase [Vitreoscilla stercoraria]